VCALRDLIAVRVMLNPSAEHLGMLASDPSAPHRFLCDLGSDYLSIEQEP
jgi:hypothetical protein